MKFETFDTLTPLISTLICMLKNEVSQNALAFDTQALMFVFVVNIILKYYNVLIINSPIIIFSRKFLLNIILLVNLCYL